MPFGVGFFFKYNLHLSVMLVNYFLYGMTDSQTVGDN